MAKFREDFISIMLIIMLIIWLIGRIANSTLMIVSLPFSGSYFIECINATFSSTFDQLASRLSDAILFAYIVVNFMNLMPCKWIRSTIFGIYVLVITLLGYHALTNLATGIQLMIDRHNGHFVDSKVMCTSAMSFYGSFIAFLFHTFVDLNIPSIQAIDIMNPTPKKGTGPQVAKKEQKAAEENIEMV